MSKEEVPHTKGKVKKQKYSLQDLQKIKDDQKVLDIFVEHVDDSLNIIGIIGNDIKAILPRDEASSIVGDDGLVEEKYITNKVGKRIQVCIKEIITLPDDEIELVVSRRILEIKVRKWMYMNLKVGMKLKGIVRSLTEYAAFIDLGGGVIGILKLQDITDVMSFNVSDVFKLGQRVNVIVKKYDRDTGRIQLSYNELLGSFEQMTKSIHEGDIIEGTVKNRTRTGIFVMLKPNLVGIADHVNGLEYGQKVLVSVKKIVPEKKKVKLIIIG